MNNYPKKYQRFLTPGEQVLWHGETDTHISKWVNVIFSLVIFFVSFWFTYGEMNLALVFSIAVVLVTNIFYIIFFYKDVGCYYYYVVTDKRIINFYHTIQEIRKGEEMLAGTTILFEIPRSGYLSGIDRFPIYVSFYRLDNIDEVMDIVKKAWSESRTIEVEREV